MAGIDRHVGGAGFETGKDCNDRQFGALERKADELAGTGAARAEVMRKPVGLLFNLRVSP